MSLQLAELLLSTGDETLLHSHRREIAALFCDLRGSTAFSETADPEEVMRVLGEYHQLMGTLIYRFEGTVGHWQAMVSWSSLTIPFPVQIEQRDPSASRWSSGRICPH